MQEMCEVMRKVSLLGGLFWIAWIDYKTQLIKAGWLLLLSVIGVICAFLQGNVLADKGVFAGILIGVALLIFARISRESIGFGDGWLFVVTGVYLNLWENLVLLFGSMVLAGVFATVCLVLKKKNKDDRLALAPFVLTGYVVFVL